MASLYQNKTENITKTWLLMATFGGLLIGIGYILSFIFHNAIIFYLSMIFAVGTSIWSYWFSDKAVLTMTGAKEVSRANLPEVYNIVDNLAITAGLPRPRIFVIDDPALNAFATGAIQNTASLCLRVDFRAIDYGRNSWRGGT